MSIDNPDYEAEWWAILEEQYESRADAEKDIHRTLLDLLDRYKDIRFGGGDVLTQIDEEVEKIKSERRTQNTSKRKKMIGSRLRQEVFERDAYRCQMCGSWERLSVDHIYPESKGGTTELENLQTLCISCNCSKGARV